jgi:hypothetical protein
MRNPFKRERTYNKVILEGEVKFVKSDENIINKAFGTNIGKLENGTIFGKPFYAMNSLNNPYIYHIVDKNNNVYDVAEHMIEKI